MRREEQVNKCFLLAEWRTREATTAVTTLKNNRKNYPLQVLNFDKFGKIEYDQAKIEAKKFFLHRV